MQKSYPDIFISGCRTEFGKIRSLHKRFIHKFMGIEVNIFEELREPGAEPTEEECEKWGRECDLFILIAGNTYGNLCSKKISFTELEYNAAFDSDPTKIMIFVRTGENREKLQQEFIDRIGSGPKGKRYTPFIKDYELFFLVPPTIVSSLIKAVTSSKDTNNYSKMSDTAKDIAKYICQKSKYGYQRDAFEKNEVREKLNMGNEEFDDAFDELKGRDLIHVSPSLNFIHFGPKNELFWWANRIIEGWDAKNDAKWLAEELLLLDRKGEPHLNIDHMKLPEGWNIRRLNSAATYLVDNYNADADIISGTREYAVNRIRKNEKTWQFCHLE